MQLFPKQIISWVEIEAINDRLSHPDVLDTTVEEFYRFGQILFTECLQRGIELDRKLTNVLGWSTAALAFLLVNHDKVGVVTRAVVALLTFSAVAISSFALKTRMWPAPSEDDWFKDDLWQKPQQLKRFHVISLLCAHQAHMPNLLRKARCLRVVEIILPISALIIAANLLFAWSVVDRASEALDVPNPDVGVATAHVPLAAAGPPARVLVLH